MTPITIPENADVFAVTVKPDSAIAGHVTLESFRQGITVDGQKLADALLSLGYVAREAPGTRYRDSDGDTWTVQPDGTLTCSYEYAEPKASLAEIEREWHVTLRKLGDDE